IPDHPLHERTASICGCRRADPETKGFARKWWAVVSDESCLERSLYRRPLAWHSIQNRRVRSPSKRCGVKKTVGGFIRRRSKLLDEREHGVRHWLLTSQHVAHNTSIVLRLLHIYVSTFRTPDRAC